MLSAIIIVLRRFAEQKTAFKRFLELFAMQLHMAFLHLHAKCDLVEE